jgi:hypothetical protein
VLRQHPQLNLGLVAQGQVQVLRELQLLTQAVVVVGNLFKMHLELEVQAAQEAGALVHLLRLRD